MLILLEAGIMLGSIHVANNQLVGGYLSPLLLNDHQDSGGYLKLDKDCINILRLGDVW